MKKLSPSDVKSILHSKRANLYHLEKCRVLVNGGRVEYVTDEGKRSNYYNIPIANTTFILLGTGTSITQQAMALLAKAGVTVGFCGGGGTPLFAAGERELDIAWLQPQSEYRPTEYLQRWVAFWFDDDKRLAAAKFLQARRMDFLERHWLDGVFQRDLTFDGELIRAMLADHRLRFEAAPTIEALLAEEGRTTRALYAAIARAVAYGPFTRAKRGSGTDFANRNLDQGNYLAYGLGAVACWVLGLPHGLAVLHGKTRRGGLVFDAADLVKDALVLPSAFLAASDGEEGTPFRARVLDAFHRGDALDFIIDTLKDMAETHA